MGGGAPISRAALERYFFAHFCIDDCHIPPACSQSAWVVYFDRSPALPEGLAEGLLVELPEPVLEPAPEPVLEPAPVPDELGAPVDPEPLVPDGALPVLPELELPEDPLPLPLPLPD